MRNKDESLRQQLCLIAIKHVVRDKIVIHQFSEFVLKLKDKEFNTMKNRAETIVRFLNFILKAKKSNKDGYKINSFAELNVFHGTDYLNSLVGDGRAGSYVNAENNNLTKFYKFLAKKNLLNEISVDNFRFEEKKVRGKTCKVLLTIFPEADRPSTKKASKPLHHIDDDLIPVLLHLAEVITPQIALGFYFSIFGGLRGAEVCSCSKTGITLFGPDGESGINVTLNTFYPRKNPMRDSAQVKKPRVQSIEVYGDWLPRLYKKHIKKYLPNDGSLALFSDKKGQALTKPMLHYYFGKLKKTFISYLETSDNTNYQIYAVTLKTVKWGFHIGRGMFSNIFAEVATETELMLKRGDANPESSRAYKANTKASRNRVNKHLDGMYKEAALKMNKDEEE